MPVTRRPKAILIRFSRGCLVAVILKDALFIAEVVIRKRIVRVAVLNTIHQAKRRTRENADARRIDHGANLPLPRVADIQVTELKPTLVGKPFVIRPNRA